MKKTILGIMLLLLVVGISGSALRIQPAKADPEAQLSLETDKDVYFWGENVTITLTNICNETVEIEGYPAWTIFTYPEEEPVYPSNFSTLLWQLDPGENDTFTWNQYNETGKPVLPGGYVVRDTQGWGLSAYFQIESWVHYVPRPEEVDLAFWMVNETGYIDVTITFPVMALDVSDWGIAVRNDSDFQVDSEVWFLISDAYLQMIQVLSHTYDLGHLEEGHHNFTFSAWSHPVKSISFTLGLLGDVNYDGKVDMRDITTIARYFGQTVPPAPSNCDITGPTRYVPDGEIDMRDVATAARRFGETYP